VTANASMAAVPDRENLPSQRLLARNFSLNLIGQLIPAVAALVAAPILVRGLGVDRFGLLTIAWVVIGYVGLVDLGLGRALTQAVAERLGKRADREIPSVIWSCLLILGILGVLGTVLVAAAAPYLTFHVLKVPAPLRIETLNTFYLLACSIPFVIGTAALRGVLEAHQEFGLTTAVRVPMGVFTYFGPMVALAFSKSLFAIVGVLVVGRVVAWFVHWLLCLRVVPSLVRRWRVDWTAIGSLFRFGAWMTVSNVIGPLMSTLDRFVIGSVISVASVAYYATPQQVLIQLLGIPAALVGVLFPAFASSVKATGGATAKLYSRGLKVTFLLLFPIALVLITFARQGLQVWLGDEFARHSTRVLQWLSVGLLFNGLAQVPFALIQGTGRPDVTAKLHLIEAGFYFPALWWLTARYGIEGTAMAWVLRAGVDLLSLYALAWGLHAAGRGDLYRISIAMAAALSALAVGPILGESMVEVVYFTSSMAVLGVVSWLLLLTREERRSIGTLLGRRFHRGEP